MEMHQLRYFLAVLDEGNFTRAAAKCYVSQPSLSAQVIKLEEELGTKLFDRLGRKVEATKSGRRFAKRARAILVQAENAKREIADVEGEVAGTIAIGVTPSVAPYILPPIIRSCREKYPNLNIRVEENLRKYLLDALTEGEVEVAVSSYGGGSPHISAEPLLQESLFLVVRKDHPLAGVEKVSIRDFKDEPLVVLGESGSLSEKIYEFFGRNEATPNVVAVCSQVRTAKELVEAGLGVAILPAMARDRARTRHVVFKSLVSARMSRLVFALTHESRFLGPNGRAVLNELRNYADTKNGDSL